MSSLVWDIHELKVLPMYFSMLLDGTKSYELRKFDRDYKVGDYLVLSEYVNKEYSGRKLLAVIRSIIANVPEYGLMEGYCILSISILNNE